MFWGESWYGTYADDHQFDDGWIAAWLRGEVEDRMYSRMSNAIGVERERLWHAIAYTNFVQCVGPERRDRPTRSMYEKGAVRLRAIIEELKPKAVLLLGIEQARHSGVVVAAAGLPSVVCRHPTRASHAEIRAAWEPVRQHAGLTAEVSVPEGTAAPSQEDCGDRADEPNSKRMTVPPAGRDAAKPTLAGDGTRMKLKELALVMLDILGERLAEPGLQPIKYEDACVRVGVDPARYSITCGQAASLIDAACFRAGRPFLGVGYVRRKDGSVNYASFSDGPYGQWRVHGKALVKGCHLYPWGADDMDLVRERISTLPAGATSAWKQIAEEFGDAAITRAYEFARLVRPE